MGLLYYPIVYLGYLINITNVVFHSQLPSWGYMEKWEHIVFNHLKVLS